MAGRDLKDGGAADLHSDENWQARLEQARMRRAKALREKEQLKSASGDAVKSAERLKPWETESASAKPISPIIQEKDLHKLNQDDLDFADRVDAIRQTAKNAPEPDNDPVEIAADEKKPAANLDEETFLQETAATLQPDADKKTATEDATDPDEVLVLSEKYASALSAFTEANQPEAAAVDAETAERFAASLASLQEDTGDSDVVVDLSGRYTPPEIDIYPGADPELAKRYAAALAAFPQPAKADVQNLERGVAAGGRRIFMLTSLVVVVGFLTLPLIPAHPVEYGPETASAPIPGLQPALGSSQSLEGSLAMAVPLLPRVAPAAPEAPVVVVPAKIIPTPVALRTPGEVDTPTASVWGDAPVQRTRQLAALHDPLSADRTLVAGLSPSVTAPADAVTRPQPLVRELPGFRNVRTEVRPSLLEGNSAEPTSGTILVTALDTEDTFDALAAAIAADVARALRR